jgi:hypothetical protein
VKGNAPLSSSQVKSLHSPLTFSWRAVELVKPRDKIIVLQLKFVGVNLPKMRLQIVGFGPHMLSDCHVAAASCHDLQHEPYVNKL